MEIRQTLFKDKVKWATKGEATYDEALGETIELENSIGQAVTLLDLEREQIAIYM